METVIGTLMELAQGIDEERDKSRDLAKDRAKQCKVSQTEVKNSIRDGNRTAEEARLDLQAIDAEVQGTQANIKGIKEQMQTAADELARVTEELKDLRVQKMSATSMSQVALQQVEAVLATASLRQQRERRRRSSKSSSQLTAQVSYLHELGSRLSLSAPEGPSPVPSFLQRAASGGRHGDSSAGSDARSVLASDRQELMASRDSAVKGFEEQESKLVELLKIQRDEVKKLEANLAEQQPILADKLKQSAEVNLTLGMAERGLKRDDDIMGALQEQCEFTAAGAEKLNSLRLQMSDLLRMPAKLLRKMDTMLFLSKDLQSLKESSISFVQLGRRAGRAGHARHGGIAGTVREAMRARLWRSATGRQPPARQRDAPALAEAAAPAAGAEMLQEASAAAGPFDDVVQVIQGLISSMREQANEDTERHQWCADSRSENLNDRIKAKDALDTLGAEIRWAKAAITRLTEEMSFFEVEITRLRKAAAKAQEDHDFETERIHGTVKDHKEAYDIVSKVAIVVRELCEMDGQTFLLQRNRTAARQSAQRSGSGGPLLLFQRSAAGTGSRFDNCVEADKLIEEAMVKIDELNEASLSYTRDFQDLSLAIKHKMEEAADESANNLAKAQTASAKRQSELAAAEGDQKTRKEDLRLLEEAMAELEKNCGPSVETPEARLQRRQEEIDALKNALKVLEGQEIPV